MLLPFPCVLADDVSMFRSVLRVIACFMAQRSAVEFWDLGEVGKVLFPMI